MFIRSIDLVLDQWLDNEDADPELRMCITEYAHGRGSASMYDICIENDLDQSFIAMASEQDSIGWRRFMEGMVCSLFRHETNTSQLCRASCIKQIHTR